MVLEIGQLRVMPQEQDAPNTKWRRQMSAYRPLPKTLMLAHGSCHSSSPSMASTGTAAGSTACWTKETHHGNEPATSNHLHSEHRQNPASEAKQQASRRRCTCSAYYSHGKRVSWTSQQLRVQSRQSSEASCKLDMQRLLHMGCLQLSRGWGATWRGSLLVGGPAGVCDQPSRSSVRPSRPPFGPGPGLGLGGSPAVRSTPRFTSFLRLVDLNRHAQPSATGLRTQAAGYAPARDVLLRWSQRPEASTVTVKSNSPSMSQGLSAPTVELARARAPSSELSG